MQQFHFAPTDPTVTDALTLGEIQQIRPERWQKSPYGFKFEFHMMHEAGWPCYLRERQGWSLPKINLKDYDGVMLGQYHVLDHRNQIEFQRVIENNTEELRKMAQRYYEGVEVPQRIGIDGWYVRFECGSRGRQNPVFVRLPDGNGQLLGEVYWNNIKQRAGKPFCNQHRGSDCMVGTAVWLDGQDALGKTKRFDDYHQIQG